MTKSSQLLSDITVWSKYAKFRDDLGRRETWAEIVMRNAEMHIKKYPELEKEIWDAYSYVLSKSVVPSMRSAQFAGKTIELMPNRIYNCAFMHMNNYRAFSELMFLLLGGSGVGYSVQKRHVNALPAIRPPSGTIRYVIQDSIVGWADAVKTLMKAYFFGKAKPLFDYGDIRPQGAPLKTSGGRAPGPGPLKDALHQIELILERKTYQDKLRPIEVFDICCHIADAVLSGGIRRSATICLFDFDDRDMLSSKYGEWWHGNPQRAMANISAVLDRRKLTRESFDTVFDACQYSGSGEPGFYLTNDPDWGTNPCAEISLQDTEFCNLTEVDLSTVTSQGDLNTKVGVATFIGTLQASYTEFWYLRPEWRRRVERNALLGVSMTGIASSSLKLDFKEAADVCRRVNTDLSERIGINRAKRVTTVKPSGTTSLVMGTSSGVHAWFSPYYIRRLQLNKEEALYAYVKEAVPELVEDHYLKGDNTGVLSVPIKAPEDASFRDEGALGTLDRIRHIYLSWIKGGHNEGLNTHNVSTTVNVKDSEWGPVREWMWENKEFYSGIALLPYDNGTYHQAPFEEIDEATYEALSRYVANIDVTAIQEKEDQTDLTGEVACGGGGCEVK